MEGILSTLISLKSGTGPALLNGTNPYDVVGPGRLFEWNFPLLYPLPALVLASPLTLASLRGCIGLFAALSSGLLVFVLTRDGWQRLPLIASCPLLYAMGLVQWSPLLTASALIPMLGFVFVAKPTIGAALWLYRPTLWAVIGGALLVMVSIAIRPSWIGEWTATLPSATHMVRPIAHGGGPLLVLALLRWRRPEARLLFALACVPQTALLYETVPLFLIPATWTESIFFTALSWVALAVWRQMALPEYFPDDVLLSVRLIVVPLLYLPCLIMVLRRPNVGEFPTWIQRPFSLWTDRRTVTGRP